MAVSATDLGQILAELKSVKESLLKQCQDELAKSIAKQVVSQLQADTGTDSISLEVEEHLKGNGLKEHGSAASSRQAAAPTTLRPLAGPPAAKPADLPQSAKQTPRDIGSSLDGRASGGVSPAVAVGGARGDTAPPATDPDEESVQKQVSIAITGAETDERPDNIDIHRFSSRCSAGLTQKLDSVQGSMDDEQDKADQVKIEKLRKSISFIEDLQAERSSGSERKSIVEMMREAETSKYDTALDICIAIIIVCNAIVIGISMDHPLPVWKVIDVFFTCCFIIELTLKFQLHGCRQHFSHLANVLDFCLVLIDITQLFLDRVVQSDVLKDTPSASMFRVVRLARLVRLVRLARLKIFDDLVAMITGMIGGMTTLVWSVVFFGLIVYITALLFREFYGNRSIIIEDEDIEKYFSNVPAAMLTVFRYFFGDFSTMGGNNLFQIIYDEYGTINGIFVCLLFFIITIGLFNVIAAIFVESTLAAAFALQNSRKSERMNDEVLWGSRISELVMLLFEYNGTKIEQPLSEALDDLREEPIFEETFQKFIKDTRVIKALNELEIGEEDHKYLFDILDNDNTGDIIVSQLSDGVERLRGDPRRSDIICVDLMVRSLQDQANFLVKVNQTQLELLGDLTRKFTKIQNVAVSV